MCLNDVPKKVTFREYYNLHNRYSDTLLRCVIFMLCRRSSYVQAAFRGIFMPKFKIEKVTKK